MKVEAERIAGVRVLTGTITADRRGHFSKAAQGVDLEPAGSSTAHRQLCSSGNSLAGTVRGLHYQVEPYPESKLVWCVAGSIWDVVVDLRHDEPTYGDWAAVTLDAWSAASLRVPPGVAHGYQTMSDDAVVVYLIDGVFSSEHARTLRWDDPTVGVRWPSPPSAISESDRTAPPWPPKS